MFIHLGGRNMLEKERFRCDGCKSIVLPIDENNETKKGLHIKYIITDFENINCFHFCSKQCMHKALE